MTIAIVKLLTRLIRTYFCKMVRMAILLSFAQSTMAQENFVSGYIVSLKGDTVKCSIDFRNRGFSPDKIVIRLDKTSEKTAYSPLDIRGFGFPGGNYVSAIVPFNASSNNSQDLEENSSIKLLTDTTFLKVLIGGQKSLYQYSDLQGAEQFYIPNNGSFELLLYKKYYGTVAGSPTFLENKKFIGQLTLYFQDCPKLRQKLEHTKYTQTSLQSLFSQYYNACGKSGMTFKSKKEKAVLEWGLAAGATSSKVRFTGEGGQPYVLRSHFATSYNPAIGLFLEIIMPGNQRKWSIYNELNYTSYSMKGEDDEILNTFQYTLTHTTVAFSYIKMSNMIRYRYPIGKALIFINVGFSNGLAVSETNRIVQQSRVFTTYYTKEGKFLDDTGKYEQGYLMGFGAKIRRYSLELRLEKGNGFSQYVSLGSPTTRLYLLLGYRF